MSEFLKNIIMKPDGKTLEFKRDCASPTLLMKTLVAFANTAGGRLVIGVGDDRQIVGLKAPLDEEERLRSMITDSITPHLVPNIELITIQETTLLVVEVFVSALRPHWLKAEGHEQGIYVRIGNSNHQADIALIAELGRSAEGISFDEMPMAELSKDDLDLVAVQKFFAGDWKLDEQALVTIKLLTSYQRRLVPTKGAVLLFGKERMLHFPDAWVQCGRFTGTDKAIIFDHIDIYDHLPKAAESIMQFLFKHTKQDATILVTILREAVINALMHADYSQRGAPIRIAFFDDRIEIENPGILLPGMTLETMKQGSSRIRNHVIARVFRELNLTKRWGSGIGAIFNEAEAIGLPEPQITEINKRIRVTVHLAAPIPSLTTQAQDKTLYTQEQEQDDKQARNAKRAQDLQGAQEIVKEQDGIENKAQVKGGVDLQIIELCLTTPLSSAEIAAALGHKQLSGNLRKALPRLRDAGLIEYTIPQSHNSRLQKYRLTEKGKAFHLAESISVYAMQAQESEQAREYQKAQLSDSAGGQVEILFGAQDAVTLKAQVCSRILAACSVVPLFGQDPSAAGGGPLPGSGVPRSIRPAALGGRQPPAAADLPRGVCPPSSACC